MLFSVKNFSYLTSRERPLINSIIVRFFVKIVRFCTGFFRKLYDFVRLKKENCTVVRFFVQVYFFKALATLNIMLNLMGHA